MDNPSETSISVLSVRKVRGWFATDTAAGLREPFSGHRETRRLSRTLPGLEVRTVLQLQHRRYGDERHDAEQQGQQHQSLRYAVLRTRSPALFCVHTYIRTRTTRVHTRVSTVYLYAGARWSLCSLRATAATRTYVPNNKAFAWPQSIHCPPALSSPYPPPVPRPFLLCYIIRSGVREWCSWHIVRLCGTGTRHGAPAQPGQHRTRTCRFQRHQRPGQHLLQDFFAWQQDRKQKGTNRP